MIEKVKKQVYDFLGKDESGHSNDHIERVLNLSLKFAKEEKANETIVALIALLHDVDDYKLVSKEEADNLTNAKKILKDANISDEIQKKVLFELTRIGYSKSLEGIRPISLEGKIVSDADMCDASGVNGFIRSYKYSIKHGGCLFNKEIFPILNMSAEEYKGNDTYIAINHMFEKILKLKDLMLTKSGKKEALIRHNIIISIMYNLFEEENAQQWKEYLKQYLSK